MKQVGDIFLGLLMIILGVIMFFIVNPLIALYLTYPVIKTGNLTMIVEEYRDNIKSKNYCWDSYWELVRITFKGEL